jgi:hypothetical protein
LNPITTIVPWLLACGQKFGILDVYEQRCPDAGGRPEESYFVYRVRRARPNQPVAKIQQNALVGTYDIDVSARQEWSVELQVDLYNSQNGIAELAACCIAAQADQDILTLFGGRGVAFKGCLEISEDNEETADRIWYHHKMVCKFNVWYGFCHRKTNERVTGVDIDDAVTLV